MKNTSLIFAGILMLMMSCAEDPKVIMDPENFTASEWIKGDNGSIFPQGDEITMLRDEAENTFGTLAWTEADFGYNAAITYNIQIALQQEDGVQAEYITAATTNNTEYTVKVKDLNSWLVNSGANKAFTNNMLIRISASVSNNYRQIYSEAYRFKAHVFSTDPDRLYFSSAKNTNTGNADYALAPDFNGLYNGFVNIPDGADGIWLIEDMNPNVKWGLANSSTDQGTSLNLKREEDGGHPIMPGAFGEGDIEASFTDKGYYRVSVDLASETKTIQIWRFYGDFFVCGQQNNNIPNWSDGFSKQNPANGTGAKFTYYPEERIWKSEIVYVPTFKTASDGVESTGSWDFKFRANHGSSWGNALNGGGNQDDKVEDGIQSGEIKVGGGKNIKFNGTEGWYYWEVDLGNYPNYKYRLIPAEKPEE